MLLEGLLYNFTCFLLLLKDRIDNIFFHLRVEAQFCIQLLEQILTGLRASLFAFEGLKLLKNSGDVLMILV